MTEIGNFLPANIGKDAIPTIQRNEKVANWLATKTPDEIADHIDDMAARRGIKLRMDYHLQFPEDGSLRKMYNQCAVIGKTENAQELAIEVEKLKETPDVRSVEMWVATLAGRVPVRKDSAYGLQGTLSDYAGLMCKYPADIVRHVLLVKTWKWFPVWHDLKIELDAMLTRRNVVIDALRNCKPKEPDKTELSEEERAAHAAKVMAEFRKHQVKDD